VQGTNHYRKFVASAGLTNTADGIALIAWAWVASLLTRDPLLIALVPAVLRSSWVLFSIPAGIVTDRFDRHLLILRLDAFRAAVFVGLAILIATQLPLRAPQADGVSEPFLFYALLAAALLVGSAEVFRDNAAQTMLPSIVSADRLERANGRLWSIELVSGSLLGPILGSLLIQLSVVAPFAANALCFLIAAALIYRIQGTFRPEPTQRKVWYREFQEGYEFLRRSKLLRTLAWLTGFSNLFFHMSMIALVLHVQENLHLSVSHYGIVLAIGALGGIIAGLICDRIIQHLGSVRATQFGLLVGAFMFVGIATAPNMVLLGLALAMSGFAAVVWNAVTVSYRQRAIPDEILGRVNSLYRLLAWGMMPFGILLSGLIVDLASSAMPRSVALTVPFWVAASGSIAMVAWGWQRLQNAFERVSSSEA